MYQKLHLEKTPVKIHRSPGSGAWELTRFLLQAPLTALCQALDLVLHTGQWRYTHTHLPDEETEAQRGQETCPTSHSSLGDLELCYSRHRHSPWLAVTEHHVEAWACAG